MIATLFPKCSSVTFWLLLSLFILSSCSQTVSQKGDVAGWGLQGSVKSFMEVSYEAKDSLGEIIKGKRQRAPWSYDVNVTFDNAGYFTGMTTYNEEAVISEKSLGTYDSKHTLGELIVYDGEGKCRTKTVSKYDANGNCTEAIQYDASGNIELKWTYEFNDADQKIESCYYSREELYTRTTFEYNEQGFNVRRIAMRATKQVVRLYASISMIAMEIALSLSALRKGNPYTNQGINTMSLTI